MTVGALAFVAPPNTIPGGTAAPAVDALSDDAFARLLGDLGADHLEPEPDGRDVFIAWFAALDATPSAGSGATAPRPQGPAGTAEASEAARDIAVTLEAPAGVDRPPSVLDEVDGRADRVGDAPAPEATVRQRTIDAPRADGARDLALEPSASEAAAEERPGPNLERASVRRPEASPSPARPGLAAAMVNPIDPTPEPATAAVEPELAPPPTEIPESPAGAGVPDAVRVEVDEDLAIEVRAAGEDVEVTLLGRESVRRTLASAESELRDHLRQGGYHLSRFDGRDDDGQPHRRRRPPFIPDPDPEPTPRPQRAFVL